MIHKRRNRSSFFPLDCPLQSFDAKSHTHAVAIWDGGDPPLKQKFKKDSVEAKHKYALENQNCLVEEATKPNKSQ